MVGDLTCKNVSVDVENEKKEIDNPEIQKVNFFGGEPTIQKEFWDLFEFCKDKGKFVSLSTNGRLFMYDKYAQKIKNIDLVNVSLYGDTSYVHENITQAKDSFDQTVKGIKNLVKYNIPTMVNVVIMKPNYQQLIEIIDFVDNLKVKIIRFSSLLLIQNATNHIDELNIKPELEKPYLNKALNYLEKKGNLDFFIEKTPICMAPKFHKKFIPEDEVAFIEAPFCKECQFNSKCVKFDREYVNRFGFPRLNK